MMVEYRPILKSAKSPPVAGPVQTIQASTLFQRVYQNEHWLWISALAWPHSKACGLHGFEQNSTTPSSMESWKQIDVPTLEQSPTNHPLPFSDSRQSK
jgi:hypothetical protein